MTRKRVTPENALRQNKLGLLVYLASRNAFGGIRASTSSLAATLNVSQQTVSRWLAGLAAEGLVERGFNFVRLTPKAGAALQSVSSSIMPFISDSSQIVFHGNLARGFGEGGYYLRQKEYSRQLQDILGYAPFAGTLNIVLSGASSAQAKRRLMQSDGCRVAGFNRGGRNFGGARLFPGGLRAGGRKAACAVVLPDRTHHGENIVELVAKENLRKSLRLKEGQALEVSVNQ
jgi:riboflavin kinase, archaea type